VRSTVAIIGTGLIGTSLGLALRETDSRQRRRKRERLRIIGWDVRPSHARAALRRGGITEIAKSMEEAVCDASVIVIATPLDAARKIAPRVIAAAAKGALIIDVTPVKATMLRAVKAPLRKRPDIGYVSAHPMAGREQGGASNAVSRLFENRPFALIVAPSRKGRAAAVQAGRLVKELRAIPLRMSAQTHDRAVAAMSALPQLASIALVLAAAQTGGRTAMLLAGPGFRDTTRLATSPYDIWEPAIAANRREITRGLRALERTMARLTRAARQADVRAMERLFSEARAARKRVVAG